MQVKEDRMPQLTAHLSRAEYDRIGPTRRAQMMQEMREIGRDAFMLPISEIWFHWDPFEEGYQGDVICVWIEKSVPDNAGGTLTYSTRHVKECCLALVGYLLTCEGLQPGHYSTWGQPIIGGIFSQDERVAIGTEGVRGEIEDSVSS